MTRLQSRLRSLVIEGIAGDVFPGAEVYVRQKGTVVLHEAFGHAERTPQVRELERGMRFDVASLTKVVATLPAVLRTVQAGKLSLDRPIAEYLPEWAGEVSRQKVTLTCLLTHTSGLPAWRPYYLKLHTADQYLDQICREPLEYPNGSRVLYSDLGLQLIGFLLERVWERPLEKICAELVFEPLGLQQTGFLPVGDRTVPSQTQRSVPVSDVAHPTDQRAAERAFVATEVGNRLEQGMCREYAERCQKGELPASAFAIAEQDVAALPWRNETICGAAHDGNCYYGLGGVSGHAGLFSTVEDVAQYLAMWRAGGQVEGQTFLDRQLVQAAVRNRTAGLNLARGLGFEIAHATEAFGHTGFTGTSMWYDPATDTEVVVFTNRVHPQVKTGIAKWRRKFHDALFR